MSIMDRSQMSDRSIVEKLAYNNNSITQSIMDKEEQPNSGSPPQSRWCEDQTKTTQLDNSKFKNNQNRVSSGHPHLVSQWSTRDSSQDSNSRQASNSTDSRSTSDASSELNHQNTISIMRQNTSGSSSSSIGLIAMLGKVWSRSSSNNKKAANRGGNAKNQKANNGVGYLNQPSSLGLSPTNNNSKSASDFRANTNYQQDDESTAYADNFKYYSGDQLAVGIGHQCRDFAQVESRPSHVIPLQITERHSRPRAQLAHTLLGNQEAPTVASGSSGGSASGTASSGVSSASSSAGNRAPVNQLVDSYLQDQHQANWTAAQSDFLIQSRAKNTAPPLLNRMVRSTSFVATASGQLNGNNNARYCPRGPANSSFPEQQEEILSKCRNRELESSEDSGHDLYSTPNESIESILANNNNNNKNHNFNRMVKSHSINNFNNNNYNNLINYTSQHQQDHPIPIPRSPASLMKVPIVTKGLDGIKKLIGSTRKKQDSFFISTSSSEDSSATSGQTARALVELPKNPNNNKNIIRSNLINQTENAQSTQVKLESGVHYHHISPVSSRRPQSNSVALWMTGGQVNQVVAIPPPEKARHSPRLPAAGGSNHNYARTKKSPSLYDFGNTSSFHLPNHHIQSDHQYQNRLQQATCDSITQANNHPRLPISISLYDCQLKSQKKQLAVNSKMDLMIENQEDDPTNSHESPSNTADHEDNRLPKNNSKLDSDLRMAQMLLDLKVSHLNVSDSDGFTPLMHAILGDNLATVKCLLDNGANVNERNPINGLTALDLLCEDRAPNEERLAMMKLLISHEADLNSTCPKGSRLLDRLIKRHQLPKCNRLPYIDYLLQKGVKLGSSSWISSRGKQEILLRLLRKLCQDGYYLYKNGSIEEAVYRFECALKRISELEQELAELDNNCGEHLTRLLEIELTSKQLKYQVYLGLSRCDFRRKFLKRALEFAHLAILVDSTAYEGYYSKAHILKELGETEESLVTTKQSLRLVDRTIRETQDQLSKLLEQREESLLIFIDNHHHPSRNKSTSEIMEASKAELELTLQDLNEARDFVLKLKNQLENEKQAINPGHKI